VWQKLSRASPTDGVPSTGKISPAPDEGIRSYTHYALRRYENAHALLCRSLVGASPTQQQAQLFLDELQQFVLLSFVQAIWPLEKHRFNEDFQAVVEKLICADESVQESAHVKPQGNKQA